MKKIMIVTFSFFILTNVFAQEKFDAEKAKEQLKDRVSPAHYIDPYLIKRREEKAEYLANKCNEELDSFFKKMDCKNSARDDFNKEYPPRGTDDYSEKFYRPLSETDLTQKREELIKLIKVISPVAKFGNEQIELTVDDLATEILFIERYLLKVEPRDYRPL